MTTDKKKGRNWRQKYLTLEEWRNWKNNDFRHLKWEVHGVAAVIVIILGLVTAIFAFALTRLFGG